MNIKHSLAAIALTASTLLGATTSAHALDWTSTITSIAERPTGTGAHTFAVVFANGNAILAPTTSAAITERFVTMVMAAYLQNKPMYIDIGSCAVASTNCPAIGYLLTY